MIETMQHHKNKIRYYAKTLQNTNHQTNIAMYTKLLIASSLTTLIKQRNT